MALGKDFGRILAPSWGQVGTKLGPSWSQKPSKNDDENVMRFWMASGRLLEALGWVLGTRNENIYQLTKASWGPAGSMRG